MNAELWATIGTIVATLALFIVPGLIYTWYALEYLIDDKKSYARVIAKSHGENQALTVERRDSCRSTSGSTSFISRSSRFPFLVRSGGSV
jgi:hypothetical protein